MKLFNWINPLWIIDTFFTMRLEPITATSALGAMLGAGGTAAANAAITGAGIGALGSAATGSDPLKGALIGGALGGGGSLLGAGGGAVGSASEATKNAANVASNITPEVATTFMNQNISPLLTNEATRAAASFNPSQFAVQGFSDGVMNQYAPNFADIAMGKSADFTGGGYGGSFLNNIGQSSLDALKNNPVQTAGLGMGIYDRINAQPQQMQAQPAQVSRGKGSVQYEPLLMTQVPRRRYPLSLLG
jgi:hypothetical protein